MTSRAAHSPIMPSPMKVAIMTARAQRKARFDTPKLYTMGVEPALQDEGRRLLIDELLAARARQVLLEERALGGHGAEALVPGLDRDRQPRAQRVDEREHAPRPRP